MAKKKQAKLNKRNNQNCNDYAYMPAYTQYYPITPKVSVDCMKSGDGEPSTKDDYQPKRKDNTLALARKKRAKNIVFGLIMCIISVAMLVPHILAGVGGSQLEMIPINIVPDNFNAIGNVIVAIKSSIANGFSIDEWLKVVPSVILLIGIIFVFINALKALIAVCAKKKAVSYTWCAFFYMVCVATVFILAAVGIERIGLYPRVSIVNELYYSWNTSELASLVYLSVGYFVVSAVLSFVSRDKQGY